MKGAQKPGNNLKRGSPSPAECHAPEVQDLHLGVGGGAIGLTGMPGGTAWRPVKSWTECEPVQCESECEKKQLELQAPRTSGLHQEGDFGVNGLPSGIARSREMKPEVGCEPSRASSGEESATFKNGVREVPPVESAWSQSAVNFVKQISPESQGSESSVCAAVRPHQLPRSHERASASSWTIGRLAKR